MPRVRKQSNVERCEPKKRANRATDIVTSTDSTPLCPTQVRIRQAATYRSATAQWVYTVAVTPALDVFHGLLLPDKRGRIHPQIQNEGSRDLQGLDFQFGTRSHKSTYLAVVALSVRVRAAIRGGHSDESLTGELERASSGGVGANLADEIEGG
jgi:hypothetical protein